MNHTAEYLLVGVAVLVGVDMAYMIAQLVVALVLGLPIGSFRILGFVYNTTTGKRTYAGISRLLMGGRVHVLKKDPTKRTWLVAECAVAAVSNQPGVFSAKREQLRGVLKTADDPRTYDAACWEWVSRLAAS